MLSMNIIVGSNVIKVSTGEIGVVVSKYQHCTYINKVSKWKSSYLVYFEDKKVCKYVKEDDIELLN